MKTSDDIARTFSVLANPFRVEVLKLLLSALPETRTAGQIAKAVGLAPSTLAHHLREMEAGGVISRAAQGRSTVVTLRLDSLTELTATLTQLCCAGTSQGERE
jgi:DNA-binding transcriptional ArsR family regulator